MAGLAELRYFQGTLPSSQRTVPHSSRGFTLVELLAVVVITGILSLLAIAGFRRHMQSARGAEAASVIQAIRSAQESYMAENHVYLPVSTDGGGFYPQNKPSTQRYPFSNSKHLDYALWQKLAPPVNRSVMFDYLVNAGVPGTLLPKLQTTSSPDFSAVQPLDWYLIQAVGDVDGNGVFSRYAATSFTNELYVENEGE